MFRLRQLKFLKNKDTLAVFYKLLNDLLFLLVVFFFLALLADGLIPGIISGHFSFLRLALILAANVMLILAVGQMAEIESKEVFIGKKTTVILSLFSALLVFNALWKLNLFLALFILLLALFAGFFLYKNTFGEK